MTEARMPIISGNWKMNLNHFEAIQLVQKLAYEIDKDAYEFVEVTVHPPFTDLRSIQTLIDADRMHIVLGAQNCSFEKEGAFTGEVSAHMLFKLQVSYVLAGHSERRELFGESDEDVNLKVRAIFANEMTPILCCGETLDEREAGDAEDKVERQLRAGMAGLSKAQMRRIVVAYEPIWAIGTGRTALPEDAQAMCAKAREVVSALDGEAGEKVRVQYGGSVKPTNIVDLMRQPDIDGALVGGASLDATGFARIVQYRRMK
ncbi:MAG: triose-phosphate isomerase [Acidimicrobiales bacterium]